MSNNAMWWVTFQVIDPTHWQGRTESTELISLMSADLKDVRKARIRARKTAEERMKKKLIRWHGAEKVKKMTVRAIRVECVG